MFEFNADDQMDLTSSDNKSGNIRKSRKISKEKELEPVKLSTYFRKDSYESHHSGNNFEFLKMKNELKESYEIVDDIIADDTKGEENITNEISNEISNKKSKKIEEGISLIEQFDDQNSNRNKRITIDELRVEILPGFKIKKIFTSKEGVFSLSLIGVEGPKSFTEFKNFGINLSSINKDDTIILNFEVVEDLLEAEEKLKSFKVCKVHKYLCKTKCKEYFGEKICGINDFSDIRCVKSNISHINQVNVKIKNFFIKREILKFVEKYNLRKTETCSNISKKKLTEYIINFNDDLIAEKLLFGWKFRNYAKINSGITIPYNTGESKIMVKYIIERHLRGLYLEGFDIPIIEVNMGLIMINGANNINTYIAKSEIYKIVSPKILNISKCLLLHVNNMTLDEWEGNLKYPICVFKTYGRIIIWGLNRNKNIVSDNITYYFNRKDNILHEEIVHFHNKKILELNFNDSLLIAKEFKVFFKKLKEDIIILGPKNRVIDAFIKLKSLADKLYQTKLKISQNICIMCGNTGAITPISPTKCGCEYCLICFRKLLNESLLYKDIITCFGCNQPISLLDSNILSAKEMENIYKMAFQHHIKNNQEKYYKCPTLNCKGYGDMQRGKLYFCDLCHYVYCKLCNVNYFGQDSHECLSCRNYQKRIL